MLLGSTTKMGEGTNVQTRLVALHHLDAPWRPADIEQREGRILRQGNQNEYVKIFRYVTEGSFDAYMWQTLETKCRFIAQVMTGDATVRRAEDVDSAALTYAEVKAIASGNPLVIEKATIDAEVMRLTRLKKQHAESLYQMRYRIKRLGDSAQILEREIANIREDLRTRTSTRGDNFSMTVKNETFTDRVKAGRALVFLAAALKPFESTKTIGSIGGFPISVERFDERATLLIHGKHSYRANVSDSPAGTIASLEHALDSFEDRLRERETDLAQSQPPKRGSDQAARSTLRARRETRDRNEAPAGDRHRARHHEEPGVSKDRRIDFGSFGGVPRGSRHMLARLTFRSMRDRRRSSQN